MRTEPRREPREIDAVGGIGRDHPKDPRRNAGEVGRRRRGRQCRELSVVDAGSRDHQVSWPWVRPRIWRAPARRSAGASRPRGAAAPKITRVAPTARSRPTARRATSGVGNNSCPSRMTGNGRPRSDAFASGEPDEYTTTSLSSSVQISLTNDSMPPIRGGTSLVMIKVGGTATLAPLLSGARASRLNPMMSSLFTTPSPTPRQWDSPAGPAH